MIFSLFSFILTEFFDAKGVRFNNNNKEKLEKASKTLIEYEIPASTQIIAGGSQPTYSAFEPCKDCITKITFETGSLLHTIEQYGFYQLKKLQNIDMSMCTKITQLSNAEFKECSLISSFILPPNLILVEGGALSGLSSLERLDFPSCFEKIGDWTKFGGAISGCASLTQITWGEAPSIQYIGSAALASSKLAKLLIPKTLMFIGDESFLYVPIQEFDVDQDNSKFLGEKTRLYNKKKTIIYLLSPVETDDISLPDNISTIWNGALMGCNARTVLLGPKLLTIKDKSFMYATITCITIPNSVTSLGWRTFYKCIKLDSIFIYANVKEIPIEFLSYCRKLSKIILPNTTQIIGDGAFYGCQEIDYIFIPKNVTEINSGVFYGINKTAIIEIENGSSINYENRYFYNSNFTELTSCINYDDEFIAEIKSTVKIIGNSCFKDLGVTGLRFLGTSSLEVISMNAFASSKIASISFPSSLIDINYGAFSMCTNLKTITFLEGLKTISDFAFKGCPMTQLILPQSLESIGESAFEDSRLSIVTFGQSLKSIGVRAFVLTNLTTIEISVSGKYIGDSAFADSTLQKIIFSSPHIYLQNAEEASIDEIPKYSFKHCRYLKTILFTKEIKVIGEGAFEGCSGLEVLEFGEGIENISTHAFKDCSFLNNIKIPDTSALRNIETLAFDGCNKLKSFNISQNNPSFSTEDGVLFDRYQTQIILYLPAHKRKIFDVPKSVSEILIFAFQNAVNLENITLNPTIMKIGYGAFMGCTSLQHVNIPRDLVEIGELTFAGCSSLGCGSIEHEASVRLWLNSKGVPIEALTPCPTEAFTVASMGIEGSFGALLAAAVLSDERSE